MGNVRRKSGTGKSRGFLGLGSNMGDRQANLRKAMSVLSAHPGIRILRKSSFYDTAPEGLIHQNRFLNAVIEVETTLQPEELLHAILKIEESLGRVRKERWGPRTIDIDILAMGDLIYDSENLSIPHHLMHERRFVLEPLAEIAPDFRHPVFGISVGEMLSVCSEA
jgi:2-amino-4-hydroxy-6-hydroxymethyldihydropteridine diphosphokinase